MTGNNVIAELDPSQTVACTSSADVVERGTKFDHALATANPPSGVVVAQAVEHYLGF